MTFETTAEVLNWYEKQPRSLNKEFLAEINWSDVQRYPLDKKFVPVLIYMRDVETLTDIYYSHLRRTPTGKDKIISKFMERWSVEELLHGEILNRFLGEAGIETGAEWALEARRAMPFGYKINTFVTTLLTNCFGKNFTGAHMAYGAVNEMSTLQGYRRLIELANHPVLTQILRAFMREESVHTQFYWQTAKIELRNNPFAQKLARFVIDKFWVPVGQGIKSAQDANYTVRTLFGDADGLETVDKLITRRIQELPGFDSLEIINRRIAAITGAT
jgi:hypothetical protein